MSSIIAPTKRRSVTGNRVELADEPLDRLRGALLSRLHFRRIDEKIGCLVNGSDRHAGFKRLPTTLMV